MDVVKIAIRYNLRKKLLYMLPAASALSLVISITAFYKSDLKLAAICLNIAIFFMASRIYVKLIDPDTLELRDWGWDKKRSENHQDEKDARQ